MSGNTEMNTVASGEDSELLQAARNAAQMAYAPYSRFRVGSAVRGMKGVYVGVNVENASYNLGLCAERAALAAAMSAGEKNILAVAISCVDVAAAQGVESRMPCGACRQWFSELAPDARILIDGVDRVFSVGDLLPHAFALRADRSLS
jgi:cytidine deaminase